MLFCDGTEDGQADGVIASDANTTDTGLKKRGDSLLDAEKGVLDEPQHRDLIRYRMIHEVRPRPPLS